MSISVFGISAFVCWYSFQLLSSLTLHCLTATREVNLNFHLFPTLSSCVFLFLFFFFFAFPVGIFKCSLGSCRCALFPSLGKDSDASTLSTRIQRRGAGHCRLFAFADSVAALATVATLAIVESVAIAAARSAIGRSRQRQ
jgi:hypothetical protein